MNNIYGVDLNPESVEITKLSLWLKTAQKGKKLASLHNNIKCGNSLIDDPEVAGASAFNWEEEFKEIMADGGFDVVVGNPPYGVSFNNEEKKLLTKFDPLVPDFEIYVYFISLYKKILKEEGYLSYIFPNTFLSNIYGIRYREKLLSETNVTGIVDLSTDETFQDASVRTIIFTFKIAKNSTAETNLKTVANKDFIQLKTIEKQLLNGAVENIFALFYQDSASIKIIEKIRGNQPLTEFCDVSQGYIPYRRSDLIKEYGEEKGNKIVDNREWHYEGQTPPAKFSKEIRGKDLNRYDQNWSGLYIKYGKHVAGYVDEKFFRNKRILIREITSKKLIATICEETFFNTPSIINVINKNCDLDLLFLLGVMNSSLIGWYHNNTSPKANKGLFPKILIKDVKQLPIARNSKQEKKICFCVEKITNKSKLKSKHRIQFIELIKTTFPAKKWPRSLNDFWTLEFKDFLKKLKLTKLPLTEKDDLLQLWNKYVPQLQELDAEIQKLDQEIDKIVFDLYELTPEERQIVLASTAS